MVECKFLKKVSSGLHKSLEKAFSFWGKFTYKNPIPIILVNIALAGVLIYGFTTFEYNETDENTWIPRGSQVLEDKDTIQEVFNTRIRQEQVFVVSKTSEETALTLGVYLEILKFHNQFREQVEAQGLKFEDLCYKMQEEEPCEYSTNPLEFWEGSPGNYEDLNKLSSTEELLQKINSGKGNKDSYPLDSPKYINVERMFGGTVPENFQTFANGTNNVQEAQAISWFYFLKQQNDIEQLLWDYEKDWENFAEEFNQNSTYCNIYLWTFSGVPRGFDEAVNSDLLLVQIGIILIVSWCMLALFRPSTYESRILVSLAGVASVGVAYLEAVGFAAFLGIKGSGMEGILPFILLGIGVDDMFVLMFSLLQAPESFSPLEKQVHMMKNAGLSITITSMTNIFSFAVGALNSLEGVSTFCTLAAFGMAFDYLNQITFFASCVALDLRRSQKQRGDVFGLFFCKPQSKLCCYGKYVFDQDGSTKEPILKKFLREYYAPFLMKKPVKIVCVVLFAILTALCAYSMSLLKVEVKFEWFINEDFYTQTPIDINNQYFSNEGNIVNVYTTGAEISLENNQKKLSELSTEFNECELCQDEWVKKNSVDSWYDSFKYWVSQGNCDAELTEEGLVPETHFYQCLGTWIQKPAGEGYSNSLAWNSDKTALEGCSFEAALVRLDKAEDAVQAMKDTRKIAEEFGPGNSFPYEMNFGRYEQYAVFAKETQISVTASLVTIFLIVLLMMADVKAAVLVLFIVGLVVMDLLAALMIWGESLNLLIMTTIIMAIGISVDYNAHIAHAFQAADGENPTERIKNTLDSIGVSVINGGISTLLAVFVISFTDSYVFRVFFRSWLCIVTFGIAHGLILLPILLSWIGPSQTQKKTYTPSTVTSP